MLKITKAEYICGAADRSGFITSAKPIIAVSGRSNVGKSSFINMLAGRKKLARVSKDPGRTRLINYFDLGEFILADLPGYGYAKVSAAEKAKWAAMLEDFFAVSPPDHVFSLCDCRHNPTADDVNMTEFLYYKVIPFTVIATKADKLSRAQLSKSAQAIATVLKCGRADVVVTSSQTGQGLEQTLNIIEKIISLKNNS